MLSTAAEIARKRSATIVCGGKEGGGVRARAREGGQ